VDVENRNTGRSYRTVLTAILAASSEYKRVFVVFPTHQTARSIFNVYLRPMTCIIGAEFISTLTAILPNESTIKFVSENEAEWILVGLDKQDIIFYDHCF
jgi:hypothetical protein